MQNDDILTAAPAAKYDTDEISHILPTAIGTVKILANSTDGKVRVSNNRQYDRNFGYRSVGEPNGVTDLTVRGLPFVVDFWAECEPQGGGFRVEIPQDISARRADSHGLDKATEAACKKLRSEIGLALATFLDTADGPRFLADGRVYAASNNAAHKADKVRKAREVLAAAEADLEESMSLLRDAEYDRTFKS